MAQKRVAARRRDGTYITSEYMEPEAAKAEFERVLDEVKAYGSNPEHWAKLGQEGAIKAIDIESVELQDEPFVGVA